MQSILRFSIGAELKTSWCRTKDMQTERVVHMKDPGKPRKSENYLKRN